MAILTRVSRRPWQLGSSLTKVIGSIALVGLLSGAGREVTMTEHQVKALFLLNFTRYVDWPPTAFEDANTPIKIGLLWEDKLGAALNGAAGGKTVSGRQIVILPIENDRDSKKCHILFIGDSDRMRLDEILNELRSLPVLTVGQADQFMECGGVINFVKKEGKIRLAINLDAARQARLQISSKLLNLADVVKGNAH